MRKSQKKILRDLDQIDKKIIELLKENAKITNTKIAKELNISEANVRRRIKILEEKKIILGYKVILNLKKLGEKEVIIGLDVSAENLIKIIDYLKKIKKEEKKIREIYLSYGDHDIIIIFSYSDQEELNEFIKKIEKLEGIKRICPAVLVETIY